MSELYQKDIKVWIPDPTRVWQSATIQEPFREGDKVLKLLTDDDGIEKELQIANLEKDLPHLRNPSILIGQNDLTALSYLHEPDVLHNLEVRFLGKQTIYTYCGIILVAINPYQDLPLYGLDIIRAYRGHNMGELEPHIFAIAEEAFAKLEREKSDISIIVSGESGAGKTMSAKYAMRYFAAVGGNDSQTHIERKVLASSPVMEAFGNAKTTRNNNSSRFGKFTQLLFTNEMSVMSLTGATMKTYLLEKSRVVFQSPGERNYHIFYQLCASKSDWSELLLDDWDKFTFLNQGNATQIASDPTDFQDTINSLKTCGFDVDAIKDIMHVLAGILHLGNIKFVSSGRNQSGGEHEDACNIAVNDLSLSVLCDLLQINKKDLRKWLITRQIDSYNEQVLIPHNKHAAETARDALAKHIYAKLFDFIVQIINQNLVSDEKQDAFIGVLDIYGFETFETNSFEQFCINYANEKLQQQFNQHVFKLEQEEYLKEGIVWTMIDFYDNQPCINLIEERLGVLDLLDEECRMVNGSDETWLTKLYEKCPKYEHFAKPRFGQQAFVIKHFSDTVQYESRGFVEKNRDHVSKELVGVLQMSDMPFCRQLMCLESLENNNKKENSLSPTSPGQEKVVIRAKYATLTKQPQKKTVGSQFRESLSSLISTLSRTTSHYVRCIKPNEEKAPFKWEPQKIVQQLRACGVLETVRISAAGFPSRWSYDRFYERYHLLCKHAEMVLSDWNIKEISVKIVKRWIRDPEKYRFGKSQIFFRAGQVAFLEQVRTDLRKRSIILVQANIRRFIYKKRFEKIKNTILGLQRYGRGFMAREKARELRQTRAAITIQRYFRGWKCRSRFISAKKTILGLQTRARGLLVRRKFKILLDNFKATQVQRYCRGFLARQAFAKRQKSIIIVQSLVRRFLAKRLLKKLKAEARSITHIQKLYKGLEQKIFELQQRNDTLTKENHGLKAQVKDVPELKSRLEHMRNLENELKSTKNILSEKNVTLEELQSALQKEQDEKMDILQEKQKIEDNLRDEKQQWIAEKDELYQKLEILTTNREDSPSTKRSKIMLNVDNNEIHNAYQKSVKDKENLENENASLKVEVKRLQYILTHPNELEVYSKSISNTSNDDSLESKRSSNLSDIHLYENHRDKVAHKDATAIILRLRKLLEEEKSRGEILRKEIGRFRDKTNSKITVADIIRLSELEVENEKLKQDYQLLRNSIDRDVAGLELENQYQTVIHELARSREEVVQLKAILAQQSESLRSLSQPSNRVDVERVYDENELVEAFQAQKLVNKQLELELKALTEEQNAKLVELHKQIDDLTTEKTRLHAILHEQLDAVTGDSENDSFEEILRQNNYLRCEVERSAASYIEIQEQMNELQARLNELTKQNKMLLHVIKENGLNDPTAAAKPENEQNNLLAVKKKAQNYQGIFKYRPEDEPKILQRLVHDLSPRTALTLDPGLPAFIIFMCIRYTDLVNADQHVRTLLSQFVLAIKKIYKFMHSVDHRVLWIVNAITLLNLLKQYGGVEEYLAFNSATQNEQQLKNFDLSEYRSVIYEVILAGYAVLIRQIQAIIKQFIVPAVLDHDEMSRGLNRSRTKSLEAASPTSPTEPKSLIKHLDSVYQKLKYFGLDPCYIEQFITQLMKYICAVAMNNLMLRPEICMWKTGMRIRYNVSCLEGWIRETQLSKDVLNPLQPLNEVAQVLQARKLEEEDIESLCELCPHLTAGQVLKIIKSYTSDDCENSIKPAFIEKLADKLKRRPGNLADETFAIDENAVIGLAVVYKQSDKKLEEIEIPSGLQLDGLLTKI
ncbi:unconventional myosin-Va [Culicoides brevitarsis]|uniref:unconventional myosin-Va n=1 Tax=Culicoides brevitarsis TaxID=469753 RepID=UPI00307C6508